MPKIRTHKATSKRIHVTGSGKLMRSKLGKSHLRIKKTPRVKRQYSGKLPVSPADEPRVRRLMPYN